MPEPKETPEQRQAREAREKQQHRESGGSTYSEREKTAQEELQRRIEEAKKRGGQ